MFKFIYSMLMLLLTIFLSGCYAVGDALVLFEGEIKNESSRSDSYVCNLSLKTNERELASFKITKKFRVDYTVEPKNREYIVQVFCVDSMNKRFNVKTETVEFGGDPSVLMDLGIMNISHVKAHNDKKEQ